MEVQLERRKHNLCIYTEIRGVLICDLINSVLYLIQKEWTAYKCYFVSLHQSQYVKMIAKMKQLHCYISGARTHAAFESVSWISFNLPYFIVELEMLYLLPNLSSKFTVQNDVYNRLTAHAANVVSLVVFLFHHTKIAGCISFISFRGHALFVHCTINPVV